MADAACSEHDAVSQELECVICGAVMIDPRILSCQHAFCLRCIFNLIKRDRSFNPTVKCPFGCPELTTIQGDIRNSKRNPLIHSLCASLRKRLFAAGKLTTCDWCNDNNSGTFCDRCSSIICSTCSASHATPDHEFLCEALAQRKVISGERPADVDTAKTFGPLLGPLLVVRRVENHLTETRGIRFDDSTRSVVTTADAAASGASHSSLSKVDRPVLLLAPHYLQDCICKGVTRDGIDVEGRFQVVVPPPMLRAHVLQGKSEEEKLWDSKELTTLAFCCGCVDRLSSVLCECQLTADTIRRSLLVSCSGTDLEIAASVSVVLRQILDAMDFVVKPVLHRLTLYANLFGHKYVERLCQLFTQESSTNGKKRTTRRIRSHLEFSSTLISNFSRSVALLTSCQRDVFHHQVLGLEEVVVSRCDRAAVATHTPASSDGKVRSRLSKLMHLPRTMETLWTLLTEVMQRARSTFAALHEDVHEAIRGVNIGDSERDVILTLERGFLEEAEKFFGMCGSIQHLHVLWLQSVLVEGKRYERDNLRRFLLERKGRYAILSSVGLASLDANIAEASVMVTSIMPQVNAIRQQHIALLHRYPSSMGNIVFLQSQLCNLTVQVLDLHQKEHYLKLKEANAVVVECLLSVASLITACFVEVQEPEVVEELFAKGKPSFTEPSPEVSHVITSIGTVLNLRCARIASPLLEPLLDQVRSLGRCASVFLSPQLLSSRAARVDPAAHLPEAVFLVDTPSKLCEFEDAPYDEGCKEFVISRAQRMMAADTSKLNPRSLTVTLGRVQKVWLPFYKGFFWIPDRHPGRMFEFIVDAQTGDMLMEDVPRTRLEAAAQRIDATMNRWSTFLAVNVAVFVLSRTLSSSSSR